MLTGKRLETGRTSVGSRPERSVLRISDFYLVSAPFGLIIDNMVVLGANVWEPQCNALPSIRLGLTLCTAYHDCLSHPRIS